MSTSDLAQFSLHLSSFTGALETKARVLRESISSGNNEKKMRNSGPLSILADLRSSCDSIEQSLDNSEDALIGNPDELALDDLALLVDTFQESNQNKMNQIGIILRQYGYKGPAFPTKSPVAIEEEEDVEVLGEEKAVSEEKAVGEEKAVVVEDAEEGGEEGEEVENEEVPQEDRIEIEGEEQDGEASPEAENEETKETKETKDGEVPSAEEDFTTPPKPGSRPPKADTPPTPATPTLEGLSQVAKSVIRGSPLTSTKKFTREATALHNSAIKTPKRTSVSERLANLRAELSSAKKAEPAVARRSLPANSYGRESLGRSSLARSSLNARESIGRSSISFATATSFTPHARRRKFATTPHSDRRSTPSAQAPSTPATPALAPHESPAAVATASPTATITTQITPPAAASIPEEDTPATVESSGTCSSGTPETPDFDSPPNTFTTAATTKASAKVPSIAKDIAQEVKTTPAASSSSAADADSPATPTMKSPPKTPMTRPPPSPKPNETTPQANTPELPVFSTVKKLPPSQSKVALSKTSNVDLNTPPTPPLPTKLHSQSAKKAVKECIPMEEDIIEKNPAMAASADSLGATPPMIPLTMSSKKSARAYARMSATQAEKSDSHKSPTVGTPEVPAMRASTVTKPARPANLPMATPDIDSLAAFDSPEVNSPAEPAFAVSTVKKAAPTPSGGKEETGKALKFDSPDVSTPPIPTLAASAVKKIGNLATPVDLPTNNAENCPPSAASTGTPATPPDINDSLSFSLSNKKAIKEFARSLSMSSEKNPMSDVSSLGSPATPPMPPMSSTKKKKKVALKSPPNTPLLKQVASEDSNSVGSTPPVPPMSSTKKPRKAISPPSTPLLASASKKTIERRERRGAQEEESPSKVVELFAGKMEEEEEAEAEKEEEGSTADLLANITEDEYDVAPRLVKMQAKLELLNNLIADMNEYFKKNKTSSIPEPEALKFAQKRMMLMGLVHFGKLVISESKENAGEKEYVVV